ncbi:MAG TPA: RagB/SusD family nutrient uptake outer membrane protein [Hanamia sp.]|nr:RagB/SusD family nutrient uptake outer membrane protein [Hanamia sp.]
MKTIKISLFVLLAIGFVSCKKYLDAKPDATLAIPSTLKDLQGLLDNYSTMNSQFTGGGEILTDNYYLKPEDWASMYWQYERDYYIWQKDDQNDADWSQPYSNIFTCNLILETLEKIKTFPSEQIMARNIKGSALFFRASYFYSLVQLFAKGYNKNTAEKDPGIPLRLVTDFDKKSTRATVQQTYEQIIGDLKQAVPLLPLNFSLKTRPTKAAAYGSLARTYLAMQDYNNANLYADSCLSLYNELIDYNSLDSNSPNPISRFNKEIIFQAISLSQDPIAPYTAKIDSNFYGSYSKNDLRKVIYFSDNGDGTHSFKGDYDGGSENWGHSYTGIVTDEQYLIKAECSARLGKTEDALKYLNDLLKKRYNAASFTPITSTDSIKLLIVILNERRKELLFRGIRLTDLKRLNQDVRFADTLTRELNGTVYTLLPNDSRYVALIPKIVIDLSGIEQNK